MVEMVPVQPVVPVAMAVPVPETANPELHLVIHVPVVVGEVAVLVDKPLQVAMADRPVV